MNRIRADVVIIGSGAGGGTIAQELAPLTADGRKVLLLEQGARLRDEEYSGVESDMARALYEDSGGFLTEQGTLTLAFGRTYGGSTSVYTGTSLIAPERVIREWDVPGLDHDDIARRCRKFAEQNHVHLLPDDEINDNNRLFHLGCRRIGLEAEQFPVNVNGCRGSSLCNLGCPNAAKMGTDRVQLPAAEAAGVEIVTRAEALRIEDRAVIARVSRPFPGEKGLPSAWEPGEYRIEAHAVVVAGGAVGSPALLLRSGFDRVLPRLGEGFTCHPAFILVGEHEEQITNDVGHPKSFYLDRAQEEGYVLETCMYFPFVTAKNLTGFGPNHSALMRAFPRLQMILVLACDRAVPGNRVSVSRNGRTQVHYEFTPEVRASLARATITAARIFFAAGAVRVHAPLASPPLLTRGQEDELDQRVRAEEFLPGRTSVSAAHLMGGCAMGRTAEDSVTDASGRVHGVPWLRIGDGSLFPDSLEINPYLTIMAVADRTAEALLADSTALFDS